MRLPQSALFMLSLLALSGCQSSRGPAQYPIAFFNCSPDGPTPYPSANMIIVAATPLHFYADPDETKFTLFRLDKIQILQGPIIEIVAGSFSGHSPLPFLVYHEASENIICAPGFNPEVAGTQHSLDYAYEKIQAATKAHGDLDADYLKAEKACSRLGSPGQPVKFPLVPLYSKGAAGTAQDIAVNHSMLVFLLGLDRVWDDLRGLSNDQNQKQAVVLVCRTIDQMAKAHRQKWPTHKWSGKQQRVIDWCQSTGARD